MKFQTWVSVLTLLSHHFNRVFKPLLHKDERFYKQTIRVKIALGYPLQYSGLENPMDCRKELDTIEQLSLSTFTVTKIKTTPVLAWPVNTLNIFS